MPVGPTLQLTLIVHLHRPPGLDAEAGASLWRFRFLPVLKALRDHPEVRAGVVLAGDLIEDLYNQGGEELAEIAEMVNRGQVEMVGTPQYEPVLGSIPERDGTDQILAHAMLVRKVFGVRPVGCWIPLGIWDPSLPRLIAKAGMTWCPVEDRFLVDVGAGRGRVNGAWRTEREGYAIGLLPVDTETCALMGTVSVDEMVSRLLSVAQRPPPHVSLTVSAERLARLCERDPSSRGWLASFLSRLSRAEGIDLLTPSEAFDAFPQRGQVYLPSSAPRHIGVPWERHLARYVEANRLHKKMLKISRQVHRLEREVKEGAHSVLRPDPAMLVQAKRYLHRAQHPAAYWHGEDAGIYDPVLRARTWRDLLRSEQTVRRALQREDQMSVEGIDLNGDGVKEVVFRTPSLAAVVDPAQGAGLTELSWFGAHLNVLNVMTRIAEPYHVTLEEGDDTISDPETTETDWADETTTAIPRIPLEVIEKAERGLQRAVGLDPRARVSVVERLIGPRATLADIRGGQVPLTPGRWELITMDRHGDDALRALFSTEIHREGEAEASLRLQKRFTVSREPRLEVRFEIANRTHSAVRTRLTAELNLSLDPDASRQSIHVGHQQISSSESGEGLGVQRLRIDAPPFGMAIALERPAKLAHYPIQTVHRHRGEKVSLIQGTCLILEWPIELWGRERDAVTFTLELLDAR